MSSLYRHFPLFPSTEEGLFRIVGPDFPPAPNLLFSIRANCHSGVGIWCIGMCVCVGGGVGVACILTSRVVVCTNGSCSYAFTYTILEIFRKFNQKTPFFEGDGCQQIRLLLLKLAQWRSRKLLTSWG